MLRNWFQLVPLPLRLIVGGYLIYIGFPILFDPTVHADTIEVLQGIGIPFAPVVIWGVASIAFLGGILFIVGAFVRIAALLQVFSVGAHVIFALAVGGFPMLESGAPLPIPDMITSLLVISAAITLIITGAGLYSVDASRGETGDVPFADNSVHLPLRLVVGLYSLALGTAIVMTIDGRENAIHVLEGIGMPLAHIVVWGVGLIAMTTGLFLSIGVAKQLSALLQIFSVGAHVLMAAMVNGFPDPLPGMGMPIPGMSASLVLLALMASLFIATTGMAMARSKDNMNLLNLMSKVKPGHEDELNRVLAEIQADLNNNPYIRFGDSKLIHFARFFTTRHPDGPRLGMGVTFNGQVDDFAAEMVSIAPGLDKVWGHCEGYTSSSNFAKFAKDYSSPSGMIYYGFPAESVANVRNRIEVRKSIQDFLGDDPQGIDRMLNAISSVATKPTLTAWIGRELVPFKKMLADTVRGLILPGVKYGASLLGSIDIPKYFSPITTNFHGDVERREREMANVLALETNENTYAQSTMTVVADIKPGRTWIIRALFAVAPPLMKYGWPRGEFAGVYSLHSFRFTIIDGGKRVWFMSNYNGSAENYFSDFIDKLSWGINTAYTNCTNYPPGGMMQTDAFANWIRDRQHPNLVYYSAYPAEGILKSLWDRQISMPLADGFDRERVEELLARL